MATLTFDFLRGYVPGDRRESTPAAYQYDLGHEMQIAIPKEVTTAEIHYYQGGMETAECYEPTSITAQSDGSYLILASVPNKLFEAGSNINVYVVVTDNDAAITTYEGRINVVGRGKPADYVDPDPESGAAKIMAISFTDPDEDGNIVVTVG